MAEQSSWRLKFQRAQDHLADIQTEVRHYANSHPYKIERRIHGSGQSKYWLYIVRMTAQPRDEIALIYGDFVHNLRSALDHITWACALPAERGVYTSFPIEVQDPWRRDDKGVFFFNDEFRERFERQVRE